MALLCACNQHDIIIRSIRRRKTMASLTQPLRDEHKELLPNIELLRTAADAVGDTPIALLREQIDAVYEFLTHHLIPHAQAEDRALYPVVGKAMGAPEATATMSRDHVEVGRLTEELALLREHLAGAAPGAEQAKALRRVLYGLYALVKVHFAKEEEIYLPILEARLTTQDAQAMFAAMEAAAHEVKSHLAH
jgi:iron-sulfur cluster repair protein YtfE (RIC family)